MLHRPGSEQSVRAKPLQPAEPAPPLAGLRFAPNDAPSCGRHVSIPARFEGTAAYRASWIAALEEELNLRC